MSIFVIDFLHIILKLCVDVRDLGSRGRAVGFRRFCVLGWGVQADG